LKETFSGFSGLDNNRETPFLFVHKLHPDTVVPPYGAGELTRI